MRHTGSKKLPLIAGVAAGAVGLLAVLGTALASTSNSPTPAPTTAVSAAPTSTAPTTEPAKASNRKDVAYDTAEDLYQAITHTPIEALSGTYTPDNPPTANSTSSGTVGPSDDKTSFMIYPNRPTLLADADAARLGSHADFVLVGPNWLIISNHTNDIQPIVGGEHPTWAAKETPTPAPKPATKPKPTPKPKPAPKPEPTLSSEQEEAVEAAESYLDSGHFSRLGLIEQLSSQYGEGFPKKVATFAVDHVHADWKAEAVEAAESYLDSGHFSRSGLIEQLESPYGEHFTHAQAVYGANKAMR